MLSLLGEDDTEPDDQTQLLSALGSLALEPIRKSEPSDIQPAHSAFAYGFSLHAGVAVEAKDRKGLFRLLKYASRPPFAAKNLTLTHDSNVRLKLRKAYFDGRKEVTFEPMDLMRRQG